MMQVVNYEKFDLDLHKIKRTVKINGVSFDEDFIAKLISEHLSKQQMNREPTITDAFNIYIRESPSSGNWRFVKAATRNFNYFKSFWGDIKLVDLKHWHITQYRDYQLTRGLKTASVRKHHNTLNAMLNMAFRHLDIDRLSPFRALRILNENEDKKTMPIVTSELILNVKKHLLSRTSSPHCLIALVQLNTGFRLSEPVFARLEDCVLDHDIPHLWVRKTSLCERKTKSSIRAVPLYGVSLDAAKELVRISNKMGSQWFAAAYARDNGNTSCSAIIRKTLKDYDFRSHMFRHAIIDRMKACNDIPTHLAESITGHSSGKSHFHFYGTVGYTLEQKLEVIKRVAV
jgi:integrase